MPTLHRRVPDWSPRRARHARRDALPLVLDTGIRPPLPVPYREQGRCAVYGCDICQDVCPWNRGVEKRRSGDSLPEGAEPHVPSATGSRLTRPSSRKRYDRLFVPRKRRTLAEAETPSSPRAMSAAMLSARRYVSISTTKTRCCASMPEWALGRLEERADGPACNRAFAGDRPSGRLLFAIFEIGFLTTDFPRGYEAGPPGGSRRSSPRSP